MDTTRNICIILTPDDLLSENIRTTVKTIEYNPNKFYLLQFGWRTNLWEVVEQLGKVSEDDNMLTRMRIAYDFEFELDTELKTGDNISAAGVEAETFADLLELMEFDENLNLKRGDYHVIINDEDIEQSADYNDDASREVAKLFQQTVFLNLVGLDIQKKSEIRKALIKDRFRANYSALLNEIQKNEDYINETLNQNSNLSDESRERALKIIDAFHVMLDEFKKAKSRPIRIAAMGTKKAGKSVVINSLLKRDYAPTSSTLPTPNTIKYIPADPKSDLTLEYGGKTYTFTSAKALKDFIGEEFKKAQKESGEGAGLPNMTIYYPCDDLNGYEVWDTPGPNVAFTDEHQKNAEECIKEVDVCIFVMNYSNHLTNDEVNFLQKIHEIFKKNNKFYSLFITVNRIDERYAVDEEKSVDRILDYISVRLAALNPPYKNITIFGTSALQSFYLDDVIDLVKADRMEDGENADKLPLIDADSIFPLMKRHKNATTQIKFVNDAFGSLKYFHDIENATEKELYALSGVPQLWSYTKYIGEKKADMEIVDRVVGVCETQFAIIKNSLLVADLLKLTEEDRAYLVELGKLIEGLKREVDKAINEIQPLMTEDKLKAAFYDVGEEIKSNREDAKKTAAERCENILKNATLTKDDVILLAEKNTQSDNVEKIIADITQMVLGVNKRSAETLDKSKNGICEKQISKVENGIQRAQEKISQKTAEVKSKVTNSTAQGIMESFQVPEFPSGLDHLMSEVQRIDIFLAGVLDIAAKDAEFDISWTETVEREANGIWENICSFFGKTYYEQVTRHGKDYDVGKFKKALASKLVKENSDAVDKAHEKMEKAIQDEIREIFKNVKTQCDQIGDSYKKLYADFAQDIRLASDETSQHRDALERDIATFNGIKENLQPFFDMWYKILYSGAKE